MIVLLTPERGDGRGCECVSESALWRWVGSVCRPQCAEAHRHTHTLAPCDQQSDKKHPRREQAQRQLTIEEYEKEGYAAAYGYLGDDDTAVIW